MAIEGFDYKEFATMMSSQAGEIVPANFNEMQKNYVIKTLSNFTLLAGEAIANDESLGFNADQAIFVTQIIAEWAFHKSIDLVHSGILPEHWDGIMQKIAFTIFEIAKQAIAKNIPQDQILQLVEHHVDKSYRDAIAGLEQRGIITHEVSEMAANQSNIDDMARQAAEAEAQQQATQQSAQPQQQANPQGNPNQPQQQATQSVPISPGDKSRKLMSVALVLRLLNREKAEQILQKFAPEEIDLIKKYMLATNLETAIDVNYTLKCIENMKQFLPSKKKPSQEYILRMMNKIFEQHPMEDIEKLFKTERPFLKRFVSKAYEGDYYPIPVKVATIVAQYIKDSV